MEFDPLLLSRIQFAVNIAFHILFPTITIGLCWFLLYFRVRFTLSRAGDSIDPEHWEYAYQFWVKIFALTFALGVVSGITMSFQFGTNWPGFMDRAGNIAGPLLGYEVLTAFFLEASFLGIMLFGKQRVSNRMHLTATALVALGTTLSAFWILSLNSWMQTPDGFRIEDGVFHIESWWAIIFNPSFPYRFLHMLLACLLTAAFLLAGTSAWRLRSRLGGPGTRAVMRSAVLVAAVLAPLQIFLGDLHGLNTLEHQPAKIAAMEGVWETGTEVPFTLFGLPDADNETMRFPIHIPFATSLILTHSPSGEVQGLRDFPDATPPVAPVFWAFRIMLLVGFLMLSTSWWAAWRLRGGGEAGELLLRALSAMTFSGWVAVLAGWVVAEVGRQPWIVYGQLRVADVVADHSAGSVLTTLILYASLYGFLLISYIFAIRYLASKPARSLGPVTMKRGG